MFARSGRVGGHEDSGRLFLQLLDGTSVSSRENAADYDVTRFRSLEVNLELRTATGSRPESNEPAALGWTELGSTESPPGGVDAHEKAIERHRRFSISAAALALGLLGTALGFHPSTSTRSRAVALCVATVLVFQGMLTVAVALARSRTLAPAAAMWLPDAVLLAFALWALARSARDLPLLPVLPSRARRGRRPAALPGAPA